MEEQEKSTDKITVRFNANYNKKLYANYFTTIRKVDSFIMVGGIYDIELKGKSVLLAQCIDIEIVKFHEIPQNLVMLDTGISYAESLDLFMKLGLKVTDFELKVKLILFKNNSFYYKEQ